MASSTRPVDEVVISVDSHVNEPAELWDALPEDMQRFRPSEYFLRQGSVAITDDPVGIHNLALTGADCILWGNDYPHDEGTFPNSRTILESMRAAMDQESYTKIMSRNAAKLYDFDLDQLARKRIPAAAP